MDAATPRMNSRRRNRPETAAGVDRLPGIAQLPHDRAAIAIIAAERSAACDIFLVGDVLDTQRGLVAVLVVSQCGIHQRHAVEIEGIGTVAVTLADITDTAADTNAVQRAIV